MHSITSAEQMHNYVRVSQMDNPFSVLHQKLIKKLDLRQEWDSDQGMIYDHLP